MARGDSDYEDDPEGAAHAAFKRAACYGSNMDPEDIGPGNPPLPGANPRGGIGKRSMGGKMGKMGPMAKMAGRPGQLHRNLGVPIGQKIPVEKIKAAAGRGGVVGREARNAMTFAKFRPK